MKKMDICRYTVLKACAVVFAALIGPVASGQLNNAVKTGLQAKNYYAVIVDSKNSKWFLTELGIISFSGDKWTLHNENSKIGSANLKDFAYRADPGSSEFWVVSPGGATAAQCSGLKFCSVVGQSLGSYDVKRRPNRQNCFRTVAVTVKGRPR